jgi:hypothetical protein
MVALRKRSAPLKRVELLKDLLSCELSAIKAEIFCGYKKSFKKKQKKFPKKFRLIPPNSAEIPAFSAEIPGKNAEVQNGFRSSKTVSNRFTGVQPASEPVQDTTTVIAVQTSNLQVSVGANDLEALFPDLNFRPQVLFGLLQLGHHIPKLYWYL